LGGGVHQYEHQRAHPSNRRHPAPRAAADSRSPGLDALLRLQRAAGNAAVARELEASPSPALQRQSAPVAEPRFTLTIRGQLYPALGSTEALARLGRHRQYLASMVDNGVENHQFLKANREEHAIVVEAIASALRPRCATLTWDPEPVLLETANVWHLSTRFRGRLAEPAPSALELPLALHPTPAIAGAPTDAALAAIAQLEAFPRGAYAGPVGWVDADGNGVWAIALRCALLSGDRATLYAGAGIVGASEPDDEVDETDRKFRAFLDALRWG